MKACIVSFADKVGQYQLRMKRLEQSLKGTFNGDFLGFTSYEEIGCEPHSEIPYKFKPAAIAKAREFGYDIVIWCDSVVYAKQDLGKFVEYLKVNNYAFFDNIGYSVGDYTNDKTLKYFDVTREQAFSIPMIMACCMGFNFTDPDVVTLIQHYYMLSNRFYPGEWNNDDITESKDMRCKGHRHDQSVMSLLLHGKFGVLKGQDTFFAYEEHRRVMPIAQSVCLFSEG
jgi:hypothetical protein